MTERRGGCGLIAVVTLLTFVVMREALHTGDLLAVVFAAGALVVMVLFD